MSFEWHRNGQPLPGRTSSSLPLVNVQSSDTGDYTVTASNAFGSATSEPAHLALHSTLQAVLETVDGVKGSAFQFSVAIEAGCDYRIQSSADLRVWTDLHRFLSTGTTYEFTDPLLPERTFHFYRVVSP